jgi:hypothetical protein
VQIYEHVGIPYTDHPDRAPGLRSFEFDIVSIEIETLTVGIPAYDGRPVLAGPIRGYRSNTIIPIGIENRHYDEDQTIEQRA